MNQPHRHRIPPTVTDVLLWLLATDVASAHLPHAHHPDRCANLRCAGQPYPCPPARDAHRAYQAATRPRPFPRDRTQATTPDTAARYADWFRPVRPPAPPHRLLPTPSAA